MSEGGHSKKEYIIIMFVLAILTVVEVLIAKQFTGTTKNAGLVILALAKALLVALFYMHLKSETRSLKLVIAIPLLFPALYAAVLMAESVARSAYSWTL
jgi:cytochrome c oxidase subunit IV